MNNNLLDCAIVRDLLSLYHDEVVSNITKKAVESHLSGCEACQKEYDELFAELPVDGNQTSTKNSFTAMMRRQKAKRIIVTIVLVLVACALLFGGYLAQLTVPMVSIPVEDVTMVKVYRYNVGEGEKFFIICNYPLYDGVTHFSYLEDSSADGNILNIDIKKPLVCVDFGGRALAGPIIYSGGLGRDANGQPVPNEITEVRIGGKTVWSQDKNGNDKIPDYVYAYNEFEQKGDVCSWETLYNEEQPEQSLIVAHYPDGTSICWDIDGNIQNTYINTADS